MIFLYFFDTHFIDDKHLWALQVKIWSLELARAWEARAWMWGAFRRSSCTSHLCTEKPRCVTKFAVGCPASFCTNGSFALRLLLAALASFLLHLFASCYYLFAFFTAAVLVRYIKSIANDSQVLQVLPTVLPWKLQVDAHSMGWETKSSHSSDLRTNCEDQESDAGCDVSSDSM